MTGTKPPDSGDPPLDDFGAFLAWLTTWPRDSDPRWWDPWKRCEVDRLLTPLHPRVRGLWLN